ncbi:hypothetical protein ARALYDRAFT_892091 [Arabidopsis lyrata subsp. lyrata]|uniref:Uncharacterized protein n=1 Tax=Arabidopsis lyrata subsp. lyrata TaxID=81972 RepID=D7KHP9_ARALL|nr:hypothetical protein ARALYDRAFT_892091 [Arabidopsis lyrata subsp. lyrata]
MSLLKTIAFSSPPFLTHPATSFPADKDENCLKDDKDLNFMRDTLYCDDEILVSTIEEKEEVLQPHESPETVQHDGEQSQEWEKALPTILEDINRSTESISTFQSDCTVENSQEFVLFEDVRASIQRSAKTSDAATPGKNNEVRETEVAMTPMDELQAASGVQECYPLLHYL